MDHGAVRCGPAAVNNSYISRPEAIHIGGRRRTALQRFRGHVGEAAHRAGREAQPPVRERGQAEIDDAHDAAPVHKDIVRRQIAVDRPLPVNQGQRVTDFLDEAQARRHAQATGGAHVRQQRPALDVLHGQIRAVLVFGQQAHIVNLHEMPAAVVVAAGQQRARMSASPNRPGAVSSVSPVWCETLTATGRMNCRQKN